MTTVTELPEHIRVNPWYLVKKSSTAFNHRRSYSPYVAHVSDTHRHAKRYTTMSRPHTVIGLTTSRDDMEYELKNDYIQSEPLQVDYRKEFLHAPGTPLRPFRDECRTDEFYKRYMQLSGNLAYRYPEPGYPRERQGAMGGSWRHVKEVNGYTGNQVCFVDGLVRLYDNDLKRMASPSKQLPYLRQSMGTPSYAPNRHNVSSYGRGLQTEIEKRMYKPWAPSQTRGNLTARH